jgi:hypothetical protein
MEKYRKDRGEGRRNTIPSPAVEKEWKREQGDGRKRKGGEMEKYGKIKEKRGGTPNQQQLMRKKEHGGGRQREREVEAEKGRKGKSEKKKVI